MDLESSGGWIRRVGGKRQGVELIPTTQAPEEAVVPIMELVVGRKGEDMKDSKVVEKWKEGDQ